jgi:hypothetical protein
MVRYYTRTFSQRMVSPRLICSDDSSSPARSFLSDTISAVSFQHSITSCASNQFPLDKASSTAFCSSSLNSSLSRSAKQSIQGFRLLDIPDLFKQSRRSSAVSLLFSSGDTVNCFGSFLPISSPSYPHQNKNSHKPYAIGIIPLDMS